MGELIKKSKIFKKRSIDKVQNSCLTNKLIITSKAPSKRVKKMCTQLRILLKPDCLANLKEFSPRFQAIMEQADRLLLSHLAIVSEKEIQIGIRPCGPTYRFQIIEYEDNYKNFDKKIFSKYPIVTFDTTDSTLESSKTREIVHLFEEFGKEHHDRLKRCIHVAILGDLIYIRQYCTFLEDTETNFKVGFKEIGPRFTLKLMTRTPDFYPEWKTKLAKKQNMKPKRDIVDSSSSDHGQ